MLSNIYVPKWVRRLILLAVISHLATNVLILAERIEERIEQHMSRGSYRGAELLARTNAELERCESYASDMQERLADLRESTQE